MNVLAALVLLGTIAGVVSRQLLFRGPPIWAIFLAGAFAMVAVGGLPLSGAGNAIATDLPVLVFLFSLFIFVAGLEQSGALEHISRWILGRTGSPTDLPLTLFVAFGLLSAFLLNDALVLVGVPMLLALARRLRVPPEPFLLTLAFSATVGSVATPFGNPQNLLVSLQSGISDPVLAFLRWLLLPTAINLLVGGLYLRWAFRRSLSAPLDGGASAPLGPIPFFPSSGLGDHVRRSPSLVLFPVTMIALVTVSVLESVTNGPSVPLDGILLGGAVIVLLASPGRRGLLDRVDWSILLLFVGLFVVVAGAVNGGVLAGIETILPIPGPGHPVTALPAILGAALGGSQVVSNVPWVGLQIPLLQGLGYGAGTPITWMALAAGATLAGNATILGAASNIIVVEQAELAGIRISLGRFVRYGLPLTAITVAVLLACLWVGL
jgi:Na+/H+ antiporter NhaD/arsenite permease-like protein